MVVPAPSLQPWILQPLLLIILVLLVVGGGYGVAGAPSSVLQTCPVLVSEFTEPGSSTTSPNAPGYKARSYTLAPGTLVIPMDLTYQNYEPSVSTGATKSGGTMNLRAYGAVAKLRAAGIPVGWAIKNNKAFGEVDFAVQCSRLLPPVSGSYATGGGSSVRSFKSGPFVVLPQYASQAQSILAALAADSQGGGAVQGWNVAVYTTETSVSGVNIREYSAHKVYVAVSSAGSHTSTHTNILDAAGFFLNTNYVLQSASQISSFSASTCFTALLEPEAPVADTLLYPAHVINYVKSGGNLVAQSSSISTYDNSPSTYPLTHASLLMSTEGLFSLSNTFVTGSLSYQYTDMPYIQIEGALLSNGAGSLASFACNPSGRYVTNAYPVAVFADAPAVAKAAAGRLLPGSSAHASYGSNIFYLGSQSYSPSSTNLQEFNGARLLLNAVMSASYRDPAVCPSTAPLLTDIKYSMLLLTSDGSGNLASETVPSSTEVVYTHRVTVDCCLGAAEGVPIVQQLDGATSYIKFVAVTDMSDTCTYSSSTHQVTCSLGSLQPCTTTDVNVHVMSPSQTSFVFLSSATASTSTAELPQLYGTSSSNNQDQKSLLTSSNYMYLSLTPSTSSSVGSNVVAGMPVQLGMRLVNTGSSSITNLRLQHTLGDTVSSLNQTRIVRPTKIHSISNGVYSLDSRVWTLPLLPAGQAAYLYVDMVIADDDDYFAGTGGSYPAAVAAPLGSSATSKFCVVSADQTPMYPQSVCGQHSFTVHSNLVLYSYVHQTRDKPANTAADSVAVGSTIDYVLIVRNTGSSPVAQSGVTLSDTLPAGATYVAGSLYSMSPETAYNDYFSTAATAGVPYYYSTFPGALNGGWIEYYGESDDFTVGNIRVASSQLQLLARNLEARVCMDSNQASGPVVLPTIMFQHRRMGVNIPPPMLVRYAMMMNDNEPPNWVTLLSLASGASDSGNVQVPLAPLPKEFFLGKTCFSVYAGPNGGDDDVVFEHFRIFGRQATGTTLASSSTFPSPICRSACVG